MRKEIIISGFGGQGIMLLGHLICYAGLEEGKYVTFFPSYGAEMRGGTANCQIIVSSQVIGSPVVTEPDVLIAMNKQSFDRFSKRVKKNGLIIVNSSIFTVKESNDLKVYNVPANNIAEKCGSILSANMVMLGVLIKKVPFIEKNTVIKTIPEVLKNKEKFWDVNVNAVKGGYNYG